jgi:DNA-binding NtrC family response regulator
MQAHILLVDDEASIRELLREVLERAGYRITSVATADEAIAVVTNDPPRLVITDLQLEESDGLELTDRIKVISPKMPILLLTGILFDRDMLQDTVGDKIAAFLEKTSSLSRITHEVKRLLGE